MHDFISKKDSPAAMQRRGKGREDVADLTEPLAAVAIVAPHLLRKTSCPCGGDCPACQAKSTDLKVSGPNDAAEIEADHIADKVMRMSAPLNIKTMSATENAAPRVHAKSRDGGAPVSSRIGDRINTSHNGGSILDRKTRGFMEGRFGTDLGGVRVHTGSEAADLNRDLDARAFTLGSDIYFADGQYQPNSENGKYLLAHEIAHVVQQSNGHTAVIQRMKACPSSLDAKSPVPKGWKPYNGDPAVFHCGYRGILEKRIPSPSDPQNECFYDETGTLVDDDHYYSKCKGTPNSFDSATDPLLHALFDPGGIMGAGWEAFWESRWHDLGETAMLLDAIGDLFDSDDGAPQAKEGTTIEDIGEAGGDLLKLLELFQYGENY